MLDLLIVQFVVLYAVIDPIGTIPVYLAKTAGLPESVRHKLALKAVLIATGVLLFFLIFAQILFEMMQIPLTAFQIAGGVVLFIFALTMIFGESKPEQEIHLESNPNELAVYPLAIPSIASPGAMMAIVMLTDNHRFHLGEQLITTLIMLFVLLLTYLFLLMAGKIQKLIGNMGAAIISRVMGLILAAVAVNNVLSGIRDYFIIMN